MDRVSISPLGLHKALATGQLANAEQRVEMLMRRIREHQFAINEAVLQLQEAERDRQRYQTILNATE